MSNEKQSDQGEVHEIAGGWITERKKTPIPGFLKMAYVGFCLFGLTYLWRYWSGETTHSTRGPLVEQFNQASQAPADWWHILLSILLAGFVGGLLWFALIRKEEE